jgi:hypothetical protein
MLNHQMFGMKKLATNHLVLRMNLQKHLSPIELKTFMLEVLFNKN